MNNDLELIISLFPIIFMLHEFEEIICFKPWFYKNGLWFQNKFPKFAKQVAYAEQLSVPAFALAVLEEFIIIGIITALALILDLYYLWLAAFLAFALHILLHIIQWIIVRKYIPTIISSLLSLPYIFWAINNILNNFSLSIIVLCLVAGSIIAAINLYFAHKLALFYDRTTKLS